MRRNVGNRKKKTPKSVGREENTPKSNHPIISACVFVAFHFLYSKLLLFSPTEQKLLCPVVFEADIMFNLQIFIFTLIYYTKGIDLSFCCHIMHIYLHLVMHFTFTMY